MIPQKNPLIASGESVHANVLTTLWENPNPTSNFAAQDIALASDNYDYTLWVARNYSTGVERNIMAIVRKGSSGMLFYSNAQNSGMLTARRYMDRISDTSYTVGKAETEQGSATTPTENNAFLIPLAVYGFKKSLDITAIVSNVSTDARQCMLSDGVTSVQKMHDSTCVVTGTMANAINTEVTVAFPSGFTADNCYVIGTLISNGTNWYSNSDGLKVFTTTGIGIRASTTNAAFLNQPFKVLIQKMV